MSDSLYRKHRPADLSALHGQDHVKKILASALKQGRVSHAYIFTGPRGTGKTSVARILASELNVSQMDLSEIDAASHRGIDDVRELRDSVHALPSDGEKKLYILDEVHMLTNEAFNALLKTLEEPPAHVYFVLCTTEPHKIPDTILSRCQRLGFRSPTEIQLVEYLKSISEKESIDIHEDDFEIIAARARGSYRDSLVLLEQVIGLNGGLEDGPIASSSSGVSGQHEQVGRVYTMFVQKDPHGLVEAVNSYVANGGDVEYMVQIIEKRILSELSGIGVEVNEKDVKGESLVNMLGVMMSVRKNLAITTDPKMAFLSTTLSSLQKFEISGQQITESQSKEKEIDEEDLHSYAETNNIDQQEDETVVDLENVDAPVMEPNVELNKTDEINTPLVDSQNTSSITIEHIQNDDLASRWDDIILTIKDERPAIDALLKAATLKGFSESNDILLEFKYNFHRKKFEEIENKGAMEQHLAKWLGREVLVHCSSEQKEEKITNSNEQVDNIGSPQDQDYSHYNDIYDGADAPETTKDLLQSAHENFGGQIIE